MKFSTAMIAMIGFFPSALNADVGDVLDLLPVAPNSTRADVLVRMSDLGMEAWEHRYAQARYYTLEIEANSVPLYYQEFFAPEDAGEEFDLVTRFTYMPRENQTVLQSAMARFEAGSPEFDLLDRSFSEFWPHCILVFDTTRAVIYDENWQRVDELFSDEDCDTRITDEVDVMRFATFIDRHPTARYMITIGKVDDTVYQVDVLDLSLQAHYLTEIADQLGLGNLDWSAGGDLQ